MNRKEHRERKEDGARRNNRRAEPASSDADGKAKRAHCSSLVPTLCVGMQPGRSAPRHAPVTRTPSVLECIAPEIGATSNEHAERYAMPLPALGEQVATLERRVAAHLEKMGFAWN